MRRLLYSAAIMAIAVGGPIQARAGDREIAQQIIDQLKVHRDAGQLKGFTLDLKVNQGVVLLRGSVAEPDQKTNVLAAADGIEGVLKVVDEIEVRQAATAKVAAATPAKAPEKATEQVPAKKSFSMREALMSQFADEQLSATSQPVVAAPIDGLGSTQDGVVQTAAVDEAVTVEGDSAVTAAVVQTLGAAQREGQLKGFGVDVNTREGVVYLSGRASSPQQRDLIARLVSETLGVVDVVDQVTIVGVPQVGGTPNLEPFPMPLTATNQGAAQPQQRQGVPARTVAARGPVAPMQTAPYPMGQQQGYPAQQASIGMAPQGVVGPPVPMAPYSGVASGPSYEQPYLPNYAWPGYAAYPNYAAVSYPQQYSPSAFPYIGPFYPYPQVPLGWRKVALEWDDGWWFLDFTDR